MANTEQAAEPTMEEILSSIRRIISDENGEDEAKADAPPPAEDKAASEPEPEEAKTEPESEPEPEQEEAAVEPEEVKVEPEEAAAELDPEPEETKVEPEPEEAKITKSDEDFQSDPDAQPEDDDIIDLTDVVDEPANDDEPIQAAPDDLELVEPEPEPEPAPPPVEQFKSAEGAPHLQANTIVGDDAQDAAMAAFNMLAGTLLTKDGNSRSLEDLVQIMLRPMLKSWLDENLPNLVERLVQDEIERISRGHRT